MDSSNPVESAVSLRGVYAPVGYQPIRAIQSALRICFWATAALASLLVFPDAIPWMIAAWLTFTAFTLRTRKLAATGVLVCGLALLIKQPGWTLAYVSVVAMGTALSMALFWDGVDLLKWSLFLLLCVVAGWFALDRFQAASCSHRIKLQPGRPVVCLGDSLTESGYPVELQNLIQIPVASPLLPPGIWVGKDFRLSEDGLHPNMKGNKLFADYARMALVRIFGDEVVK